jgi:cellulose synthase/poly-beta-1,6-N-acetylglucosamine synthase-like glycosyltransferase
MSAEKLLIEHWVSFFNVVLAGYFIAGNGVYTILMAMSLISVWVHNRRLAYQGLRELKESLATPPVTIIMPLWNEQDSAVASVRSALAADYPGLQVIVINDGSTDHTLERLIEGLSLVRADFIYRPQLNTRPIEGFYVSSEVTNLVVVDKQHGGKPDALNTGINLCRTPYFCTLDADCVLEPDALLRLMRPVVSAPINTVASGGIVRVLNGCEVKNGRVVKVELPRTSLERFQVVEYLRGFLFGRTGWDLLGGTLIVSGAFALFHRQTVASAGGFNSDTVTEDMELIVRLHRWARHQKRRIRMSFTSDPVCWTECPTSLRMLGRQRRRWQLGLCQTLARNLRMLFNPAYGAVGMVSFPFHLFIVGLGAVVEFLGYLSLPLLFWFHVALARLYAAFILLGLAYAMFLSVGSVLLEEITHRRYPRLCDLQVLLLYALLENFGYRQAELWFRVQGVARFFAGFRQWEKVTHYGAEEPAAT